MLCIVFVTGDLSFHILIFIMPVAAYFKLHVIGYRNDNMIFRKGKILCISEVDACTMSLVFSWKLYFVCSYTIMSLKVDIDIHF